MARPKETCVITLRNSSTGELDTSTHTIKFQPANQSYPTGAISGNQLTNLASYMPASDLEENIGYYIYKDGVKSYFMPPLNESFEYWITPFDFLNGATYIPLEGAVHPTTTNGIIYASLSIPRQWNYRSVTLEQITVYYRTDANNDDFDFALIAVNLDGTITTKASKNDIGNGETGAKSTDCLSSSLALGDFPHYIKIDVNNTDANTDVKLYGIKITGFFS